MFIKLIPKYLMFHGWSYRKANQKHKKKKKRKRKIDKTI